MKSTEKKLTDELVKRLPKLVAYEGIIYEAGIGGEVFADCRTMDQVLSDDIIKSRLIARAVNSHQMLIDALKQLSVRFPIEFRTTLKKCMCNQFSDNKFCRHIDALEVLKKAEAES